MPAFLPRFSRPSALILALVVCFVTAVLVAPAKAATVTAQADSGQGLEGTVLALTEDVQGEINDVTLDTNPLDAESYIVTDSSTSLVAGPGCTGGGFSVICSPIGGQPFEWMEIRLGGGADSLISETLILDQPTEPGLPDDQLRPSVDGGAGDDELTINGGVHLQSTVRYGSVLAGIGNDVLNASASPTAVFLAGEEGHDAIYGGGASDWLNGGAGNDEIYGSEGDDRTDSYAAVGEWSSEGDDLIYGQDGNDDLFGGAGNDEVHGGLGNDTLFGGLDADTVLGADGDDGLDGGDGDDTLSSAAGNDSLGGGAGSDELTAGIGDDLLSGDSSTDVMLGEEGSDLALYIRSAPVYVTLGQVAGDDGEAGEAETLGSDIEAVTTGDGDDVVDGTAVRNNLFSTRGGDDTINELDGEDVSNFSTVDCGTGTDSFVADTADQLTDCESPTDPANQAPTATIGVTPEANNCWTFTSLSSDPDGSIIDQSWSVNGSAVSGSSSYFGCFSQPTTVVLEVTDDGGLTATDQATVTPTTDPSPDPTVITDLLPPQGYTGDQVVIIGTGFCADTNAWADNSVFVTNAGFSPMLQAEVVAESPTQITIIVPAGFDPGELSIGVLCNGSISNQMPWTLLDVTPPVDPPIEPDPPVLPPDELDPNPTLEEAGPLRPQANIIIGPAGAKKPDAAKKGKGLTLDGRASTDADGGKITKYRWYQGKRLLSKKPLMTKVFKAKTRVRLKITDDDGQSHKWQVTVEPTAKAPLSRLNIVGFTEAHPTAPQKKALKVVRSYLKKTPGYSCASMATPIRSAILMPTAFWGMPALRL